MSWPKRLVIVRHGHSALNEAFELAEVLGGTARPLDLVRHLRDVDIPLTETGVHQARATGLHLSGLEPFDAVFSSPYVRALRTAETIVGRFGYSVKVHRDNRLREKDAGLMYGLSKEDIRAAFPREAESRKRDGKYWYRPPGGEHFPDVEMRVHGFLEKLIRDEAGRNVLLVTHAVTYVMFRALFEHLDEERLLALYERDPVPNCGMQTYEPDATGRPGGRMRLVEYNRVAYDAGALPPSVPT